MFVTYRNIFDKLGREIISEELKSSRWKDFADNEDFIDHILIEGLKKEGVNFWEIDKAAKKIVNELCEYMVEHGPEEAISVCSYAIHAIEAPDERLWALHTLYHRISS